MVRLFLLSVLLLATKVTFGQECTAEVSTNWTTCLLNNLDTCTGCNTTSANPSTGGTPTCGSITNDACPTIKCCRACETAIYDYFQNCYVDIFVQSGLLSSCTLDCSAFPYGDTNVNNTEPCLSEYGKWASCLIQGNSTCDNCQASNITESLFSGQADSCTTLESLFCDQISCCTGCEAQAQAYFSCAYTEYGTPYNCSSFGNCTFSPTAPIAPTPVSTPTTEAPTSVTTPAPSELSATTPEPSASTTPEPSASTTTTPVPSVAPAEITPTATTPTDSSSPCSSQTDTLTQCFESNAFSCSSCFSAVLNLNETTTAPKTCEAANGLVCPFYTCCPSCSSQLRTFFDCQTGLNSSLSGCVFNCGGNGSKTNSTTSTTSGGAAMLTTKWWSLPVMATLVFAMLTNVAML